MTAYTHQQWLTELVRVCEREPNRIGLCGSTYERHKERTDPTSDHCIIGQVSFNLYGSASLFDVPTHHWYGDHVQQAVLLNNAGVPWGEIPKRLGLVPGEWPVEAPEPAEVAV